jgi:RNA polymerase sigma-B factor
MTIPGTSTSEHEHAMELFRLLPDDKHAREQLIEQYTPLARYLATRFRGRAETLEDLIQVAMVGLIKAVDRFDATRDVRFTTYASATILGEIKRHFRDRTWALRVPRRLQELGLEVSRAVAHLHQEKGASPSVREIAERVAASEEEVLEAMDAMTAYSADSLDAPGLDAEGSGSHLSVEDDRYDTLEAWESVVPAIKELPPREKRILYMRFFRGRTQSEIAEELGISQMHVSRLLAQTLEGIRRTVEADEP